MMGCKASKITHGIHEPNEEPRGKPRGIKSESGQIIRRKRRGIDPEEIKISDLP
jgi:hypothetical protein